MKESTYAYYCFEVQHYIIPAMGNMIVGDITEEYIQNIVLQWQNNGKKNGNPLRKSTAQNLVMIIKQVLKYAVKEKIIEEYWVDIHFAPQSPNKKIQVFDKGSQNQLIQAILRDLSYKNFGILLYLNSGLRIGELCALKWNDIDLDNKLIYVTKTCRGSI